MASVHSPIRTFLKPILFKLFGHSLYPWFQAKAKIRDIDHRLVEETEMELLPLLLGTEDEAIDIGANYAYYTERMARLCKKVYAFEPIPFTHKVCAMVVRHYGLKNVELHAKGVGEKNEVHTFSVPVTSFGAISAGQSHFAERFDEMEGKEQHVKFEKKQEVKCQIIALDSFIDKFENIRFIKIDIEGAEYFALKGMEGVIKKFRPVILVEVNPFFLKGFDISEETFANYITQLGYQFFRYDAKRKKLVENKEAFVEANYILLDKSNLTQFQKIIHYEI